MELLRKNVREFAEREIAPIAREYDARGEFPSKTVMQMGELGLLGMLVPTDLGGAGASALELVVAVEEVARVDGSHALIMAAHNSLCTGNILIAANDEQKRKYVPDLAAGKKIGAWALTEPSVGSDAGGMKTAAKREGRQWVLNGAKNFCTNAPVAGTFVIIARTEPTKGNRGIGAFVVEKGTPGLHIGKMEDKLGMRASATSQVVLEDCRVPAENLLGEEGEGYVNALKTLDGGRLGIGALGVGIAQGAFEQSVRYAKERTQFGEPIAGFQAIQWKLADMAGKIEAARMVVYRAAWFRERTFASCDCYMYAQRLSARGTSDARKEEAGAQQREGPGRVARRRVADPGGLEEVHGKVDRGIPRGGPRCRKDVGSGRAPGAGNGEDPPGCGAVQHVARPRFPHLLVGL